MRRKGMALLSLTAAALLVGGSSGTAHANEASKFDNDTQILSCLVLEVLDIPILSSANNSIDCSENHSYEKKEKVTINKK
ncbi:hypothetical protein [Streptomyces roseolilacinus]|uniref:hypothetical protein n=1 Tax=Streptomyces roseolilacinus TaxID=66904 RepID=UPI0038020C63